MRLIPRDDKYFSLLTELASRVKEGGEVFVQLFEDYQNRSSYADKIKSIEVACDELSGRITQKLNSSFITPIDREDIYLLTTELDDVIDMINGLARRMLIYDVTKPRNDAIQVAEVLAKATVEIERAFSMLEQHENFSQRLQAISALEKQADQLYSEAVSRLFKDERDPIEVIKWVSIYESLENSVDRCKDVAEALEAVVVKNK